MSHSLNKHFLDPARQNSVLEKMLTQLPCPTEFNIKLLHTIYCSLRVVECKILVNIFAIVIRT